MTTHTLESLIDAAFERRADITPANVPADLAQALSEIVDGLNAGPPARRREDRRHMGDAPVAEEGRAAVLPRARQPRDRRRRDHATSTRCRCASPAIPTREFRQGGFRVVPPAVARTGAFIGRNVVLMPSYVNIGAYVDEGTMVDTWATVGSCAQIGKNVHLSGGVGIGGVLEPLQANPTIIEDTASSARAPRSSKA